MNLKEGKLEFEFSCDEVIKLDDSNYYRKHFIKIENNLKAVDFLFIDSKNINYLIEVKDYTHPETKSKELSELIDDLIIKILCSLSIIFSMRDSSFSKVKERKIAERFLNNNRLKIIFHIEKPPPRRKLEQSNYKLDNIRKKLREKLKVITSQKDILVVSKNNFENLPWKIK